MKKTTNKQIEQVIKHNKKSNTTIKLCTGDSSDDYLEVIINPNISFKDYAQMITDMRSNVCSNGRVNEFAKEYTLGFFKIYYFTNIKSNNAKTMFELINCTDIVEQIDKVIGGLSDKIAKDYDFAITHYQNTIYNSSEWDDVAITIMNLLEKFEKNSDKFKNIDIKNIINIADKILKSKDEFSEKVIELHQDKK